MKQTPAAALLLCLPWAAPASAGVFLETGADNVTHAGGYDGNGGLYVVKVCLDTSALPIAGDPSQATRNVIAELNRFVGRTANVGSAAAAGIAADRLDYESMLMHEMGHCLGLDHNVLGPSEVGCSIDGSCVNHPALFFVNAGAGPNGLRDVDAGLDGARGTGDDARGDDTNRHWYRAGGNDPFAQDARVDRGTHSTRGALPAGDLSAEAVANFSPCTQGAVTSYTWLANGRPPTQDVAFPVLCTANLVRALSPNDRTTLRLARAGLDGIAATQDDYSVALEYVEYDQSDCDVVIRFAGSGFSCAVDLATLPNGDTTVVDGSDADRFAAVIRLQPMTKWYFNPEDTTGGDPEGFCDGFEEGDSGCAAGGEPVRGFSP